MNIIVCRKTILTYRARESSILACSDESEQEKLLREKIEECNRPDELVNYMRKPMNIGIRELLIGKLLKMEDEVIPLIKEKCLRNSFDTFIENAVRFLIVCRENCSE